jgi:hypothetical protein
MPIREESKWKSFWIRARGYRSIPPLPFFISTALWDSEIYRGAKRFLTIAPSGISTSIPYECR